MTSSSQSASDTAAAATTGASTAPERDRKAEHIELALDRRMQVERRYFQDYTFEHDALPDVDWDTIDLSVEFLGKKLNAPLLLSCMTGGTDSAAQINANLAEAAERCGVALGVGSQRKALEDPATAATFDVRSIAPTIPLLGNLGAVQLNYGYGLDECRRAIEMIDADALVFHLNPLQEAIQPEGDRNFKSLLPQMAAIVDALETPVIAKEIGCGITGAVARKLVHIGIEWIDTAGVGGTSWARIEAARADDHEIGELFADWGVPTPESILQVARVPGARVIGSGGLRTGIDCAKAIALGSEIVGLAQPFLAPALESADAVVRTIERVVDELKTTMLCVGADSVEGLRTVPIHRSVAHGRELVTRAEVVR